MPDTQFDRLKALFEEMGLKCHVYCEESGIFDVDGFYVNKSELTQNLMLVAEDIYRSPVVFVFTKDGRFQNRKM